MRRNCAISCILLLAFFAVAAVSLACIGIYREILHAINQRAREFCIRTALGAQPRDITRVVLRSGIQLSILSIVVGLFMALALSRLIASLLCEVKTYDPLVFLGSVFFTHNSGCPIHIYPCLSSSQNRSHGGVEV